jgi:16S rRNA (cytidine1402-2'-O)-methyltransferase
MLESLKEREETLIFYEAPHRIIETLTALEQSFGAERRVCLARELTKIHEEYTRASLGELTADFNQIMLKGEFVIVVEGLKKSEQKKEMSSEEILKEAQKMIQGGKRKTEIAKTISDEIGTNKDYVYKLIKDL